ncbi:MAG: hypothetical protein CVU39_18060 [Chloroflexi bacterium HGW-Chloroflexi-10]|nr:MAG: hypothetical protein CVU39_18060 [Chloroflexi bacterium HGW-Chloroflexi-10]
MKKRIIMTITLLIFLTACMSNIGSQWRPQVPFWEKKFEYEEVDSIVFFDNAIWFTTPYYDSEILRFDPKSHQFKSYLMGFEEGKGSNFLLYVSKEQELWGAGGVYKELDLSLQSTQCKLEKPLWLLSRYDKEHDRFIPVEDEGKILKGCRVISFTEDDSGNLWVLTSELKDRTYLFKYNPQNNTAYKIDFTAEFADLGLVDINAVFADPSGVIWFYVRGDIGNNSKFIKIDPITEELVDMGILYEDKGISKGLDVFYFDKNGILWTQAHSWGEVQKDRILWHGLDEEVFKVINYKYETWGPSIEETSVFQSILHASNGKTFISTDEGLFVYDPISYKTKKFSSLTSSVIEDDKGHLWTALNGQVYRYFLRP